jgi:hypothetical protein
LGMDRKGGGKRHRPPPHHRYITHTPTPTPHPQHTTQLAEAYERLVPFPMDLGTLHLKLQGKRYRTIREFHGDVELFFCGFERVLHGQGGWVRAWCLRASVFSLSFFVVS